MLIDKIILAKTKYTPEDFTGGNIQVSTSKYTLQLTVKLILYFGYNATRNPISTQIKVQEKDIPVLAEELIIKAKNYLDALRGVDADEVLDLNSFVTNRYEGGTNSLRGAPRDSDSVDSVDRVDSDRVDRDTTSSVVYIPSKENVLSVWNENVSNIGMTKLRNISDARYKKLKTRINRNHNFLDNLLEALEIAAASSFIMKSSWFGFDWLVANDDNIIKVLEGNYNDK